MDDAQALSRTFDLVVNTKNDASVTFSSMNKDEVSKLMEFFATKKIIIKNQSQVVAAASGPKHKDMAEGSDDEGDLYMHKLDKEREAADQADDIVDDSKNKKRKTDQKEGGDKSEDKPDGADSEMTEDEE